MVTLLVIPASYTEFLNLWIYTEGKKSFFVNSVIFLLLSAEILSVEIVLLVSVVSQKSNI